MQDFDDPLDPLNHDGDGVIEMSILEEEEQQINKASKKPREVPFLLVVLVATLIFAGWFVIQI